jgi:hypothetical protein
MIYELRTYTLRPGTQAAYLRSSGEIGRKIRGDDYGKLEGYWTSEFGTLNQLYHLWSFADHAERDRLRAALAKNAEWNAYLPLIRPHMLAQENKILSAAVPLRPPAEAGYVYELRTYRCHVGRAGEWIEHVKAILPMREKYSKNVGLWTTEMGTQNQVVHLWAYPSLEERFAVRRRLAQEPAWQEFLGRSTPLLAHMESVLLVPTPFSPMK